MTILIEVFFLLQLVYSNYILLLMTKYQYTVPIFSDTVEILKDGEVICKTDKKYAKKLVSTLNNLLKETQELYSFRLMYNALLFNNWHKHNEIEVYKSHRHSDGELCFNGEGFIVVAILPTGQITNHYHIDDWDLFQIPVYPEVKDDFDGHTSEDVINRLRGVL